MDQSVVGRTWLNIGEPMDLDKPEWQTWMDSKVTKWTFTRPEWIWAVLNGPTVAGCLGGPG